MKSMIEALERRALLSGELDTTFGVNGVATSDFDVYSERFTAVTTDSAGRIYGAGFINGGYLVARYLPNGQIDASFGVANPGFVTSPTSNYPASAVTVSPTTGKIYVAGSAYTPSGTYASVVAFNPNGTLDTMFDGDGVWTGTWSGGVNNGVLGAAYYNNRLYVGTYDYNSLGVACFTDSGTLDAAFDGDGKAAYAVPGSKPVDFDFEPSTFGNGPLVVAGRDGSGRTQIVKFNLNGTRDTAFSVMSDALPSYITVADHIDADIGGRVLVSGSGANGTTVVRLTNTGQVDPTFGVSGAAALPAASGTGGVTSLLGTGGAVVITRPSDTLYSSRQRVTVLTINGQPNRSFGDGGVFELPTVAVSDSTLTGDGGIVFSGRLSKGNDQVDTQLVRLNRLPTPRSIVGTLFDDVNADGVSNDTSGRTTFYGMSAYLDGNNNGKLDAGEISAYAGNGRFVFDNLPANATYTVRLTISSGIDAVQTSPAGGGGFVVTTTNASTPAGPFGVHFGPITPAGASASGVVFDDTNRNGAQDAGEPGIAQVVVYVDVDNDKVLDANEVSTQTDGTGNYTLGDLADTGLATRLRAVIPTGFKQTTPVDGKGYGLTLASGAANTGLLFGVDTSPVTPALGTLSGFAFDDTDKDGVYDSTEKKTAGKTVFLDLDNDGVLDTNEKKVTTASDGSWSFTGLAAGSYRVRRVFPSGYTQSTPPIDVTLAAGQTVDGLAIGSKSVSVTPPPTSTASITGSVFSDNNKNGKYDSGDGYAKGVIVFLDTDNDGKLDTGETSVTTDNGGKFGFTKLAAGTYRVRRVMPSGYAYSTSKPDVTLAKGQAKSGVLIGTKKV